MSTFTRGDWVFVHPQEASAPREALGLAGVVESVSGPRACVEFRGEFGSFPADVDVSLLRPERRRRDRAPARWARPDVAPAA